MYCHAEFSSASVRGEGVAKARVEILKQVQDDVWLCFYTLGDPSPAVFSAWKCSATPRRPFFQRWNAPRPLADRFFSVGMLRDPSPAIFSALECSATPRGPFFQRWNASRPLAGHFFSVEMLGDPSRTVFSAWKCSATPRRPFFRRWNAPRPLAGHFFSVGMLRDSSPAGLREERHRQSLMTMVSMSLNDSYPFTMTCSPGSSPSITS